MLQYFKFFLSYLCTKQADTPAVFEPAVSEAQGSLADKSFMRVKIHPENKSDTDYPRLPQEKPMQLAKICGSQRVRAGALLVALRITSMARFTAVALLRILEPVVRFALGATALLLVLTGLFLEAVSSRPVPLVAMLACAVGCAGLLAIYEGAIRLLSPHR